MYDIILIKTKINAVPSAPMITCVFFSPSSIFSSKRNLFFSYIFNRVLSFMEFILWQMTNWHATYPHRDITPGCMNQDRRSSTAPYNTRGTGHRTSDGRWETTKNETKNFKTTNETVASFEDHATSLISVTVDPLMRGSNFICETTVGLHNFDSSERDSNQKDWK